MEIGQFMAVYGVLITATGALAVSLLSYYFSIKSWRETHRPIVTARVTAPSGGTVSTVLHIIVQNTGDRPAKNVRLLVNTDDLESVLLRTPANAAVAEAIIGCFSENALIPVLENGRSVSNSFGLLSNDANCTWRINSILNITVSYEDLNDRCFHHKVPLKLSDDTGFAQSFWSPTV